MKKAVLDLVVECGVPVRDVPKVWTIVQTGLTGTVPPAETMFTHSHIHEWIVEMSSRELLVNISNFWALKSKYDDLQVHVHHDATSRKAFEVGKDAKLMQFQVSYFDPDLKKAVSFILHLRPLPGSGSAKANAQALAICLSDMQACTIRASDDPLTPFEVELTEKGLNLVADLGSDNTPSAINVAEWLSKLTGQAIGSWPCPTHINALDGINPLLEIK